MGCVDGEGKSWYGLCGECGGVRRMRGFWGGGGAWRWRRLFFGGGRGGKWNVWACKKGGGKD